MIEQAAKSYHQQGLSVIPINETKVPGSAPGVNYSWKKHQQTLIEPANIFSNAWGVGIVAGVVSGNLECIDIDTKYDLAGTLFEDFKHLIADNDPSLLRKMVVQKTPSGGYHMLYRVAADVPGNQKLANRATTEEERKITYDKEIARQADRKAPLELAIKAAEKAADGDKVRVLIETRGEGGYFGVYPTPGYEKVFGSVEALQVISPAERELIIACAMTFNEVFEPIKLEKKHERVVQENISPFEDFNENADFQALLEENGWRCTQSRGNKHYFLRPGGEQMWSAEYDAEKGLFFVFTTSSQLEGSRAYNASQIVTLLQFNGDYSAAAKYLLSQGWGSSKYDAPSSPKTSATSKQIAPPSPADYLADESEMDEYERQWRDGTFQMGLTTGWKSLDKFFLFKRGYFNVFNGFDNVGKSTVLWYLAALAAMQHNWRVLIYSIENRNGAVRKKLIEFYWGVKIKDQTTEQYAEAKAWVQKHFVIVNNKSLRDFKDFLAIVKSENERQHLDLAICDPYNGLKISLSDNSKLSTHEYHYEAASEMQVFAKNEDTCIYLNAHVVTGAMRNGNIAPKKGDTEGGAKFANKADDFGTIHRDVQGELWMFTELHMRKIKETETGGGYTPHNEPFKMEMLPGRCGFRDPFGIDPVADWHASRSVSVPNRPMAPNNDFMTPLPKKLIEEVPPEPGSLAYIEQNDDDLFS